MKIWVGSADDGDLIDARQGPDGESGVVVADGVFETLKVTSAGPFALTRHIARLTSSVQELKLTELDEDILRIAVDEVVAANAAELGDLGRMRINYSSSPPVLVISVAPAQPWPDSTSIATVPWTRSTSTGITHLKTTSYAENLIALNAARSAGASEAVLANDRGELCEGAMTNVFVVLDGAVLTPPVSSGCLPGIARQLVMEWFGADERVLPFDILTEADEIFVTSSSRSVHPVLAADDRTWRIAGPVSRDLRASFGDQERRNIDP